MLLMKVSVIFGKKLTFGALPRDFQVAIVINATGPSQSSNSNSGIEKFPSGKYFGVYVFFYYNSNRNSSWIFQAHIQDNSSLPELLETIHPLP